MYVEFQVVCLTLPTCGKIWYRELISNFISLFRIKLYKHLLADQLYLPGIFCDVCNCIASVFLFFNIRIFIGIASINKGNVISKHQIFWISYDNNEFLPENIKISKLKTANMLFCSLLNTCSMKTYVLSHFEHKKT